MDVRRLLPTYTPTYTSFAGTEGVDRAQGQDRRSRNVTSTDTSMSSKDASAPMDSEVLDNGTRTRPLMCSVARAASFTIPRFVDAPTLEDEEGPVLTYHLSHQCP